MFPAAVFPAIAVEPNEFTDDWIKTLEIENTVLCSPAGSPIRAMFSNLFFTIRIRFSSR